MDANFLKSKVCVSNGKSQYIKFFFLESFPQVIEKWSSLAEKKSLDQLEHQDFLTDHGSFILQL